MRHHESDSPVPRQSRRDFIKKTGVATLAVAGAGLLGAPLSARAANTAVAIVLDSELSIRLRLPTITLFRPPDPRQAALRRRRSCL